MFGIGWFLTEPCGPCRFGKNYGHPIVQSFELKRIEGFDTTSGPPHVLLARTTFGRGVSYMESQIKWHYWPMTDQEYEQALAEIEGIRA